MRRAFPLGLALLLCAAAALPGAARPFPPPPDDPATSGAAANPNDLLSSNLGMTIRTKISKELLTGPPDKLAEHIASNPELAELAAQHMADFRPTLNALRTFLEQQGQKPPSVKKPVDETGKPVEVKPTTTAREEFNREWVKSYPTDPTVRVELGDSAYNDKNYQEAFRQYQEAVRHDPTNEQALLGYGHSASELGDYRLAALAAKQLLDRNPSNHNALGLYHTVKGRAPTVNLPSSIFAGGAQPGAGGPPADFAKGGDLRPGGTYAAPAMTPEQAAAAARAQAAAGPGANEKSAAMTREAAAALRVKDFPTAHQLASRAIEFNSGNAQALNFRAIASNRMNRYSDAVTDASAALALAPGNAPALQTRSWAFAKQRQYKEALVDAEETLSKDARNPFAYQNKAFALAGLKDRAGVLEALGRSAALDPRFQGRLERALQLPEDADLTLLFDDDGGASAAAASAAPPAPQKTGKRFARLAFLSAMGGLIIALAILHVVSASWRETVHATIRRVLASPDAAEAGAVAAPTASTPIPGSLGSAFWTQYEVVKEIGLGGMGVVYEAKDRSLERRVAVKKMRDEIRVDPQERRRFINEAKLVAQLRHPNIVDIYAISEDGADVYLVFEFVDGRTLHDRIRADGPLPFDEARATLRAMADAVEHAHAAQIIHRDLKPSNVMITSDGRIKVMDFGVARQAKDALTKMSMTNTVVGTPPYMAPEQEQGTVRRESDVYALGVCFYEMLTGHLPFTGQGAAMLLNKLNGKHVPLTQRNQNAPAELDAVIAKALTPDPDKRYRTPTELVDAVDAVLG